MMRILFLSVLIFITIFLIYGHKLQNFEDIQQDILSIFKKQDDIVKDDKFSKKISEHQSEIVPSYQTEEDQEIYKALEEMEKEQVVIVNPVIEKLLDIKELDLESKYSDFNKYLLILLLKIKELDSFIVKVSFASACLIFLLMLFSKDTPLSRVGLLFAQLGFKLSRLIIFMTALIAGIVWFIFKYNFFFDMGFIFFCSLLFLLISSVASLKLYDYNSPIWNRVIYSVSWLMMSGVFIYVF